MRCVYGPCTAALHVLIALIVLGCLHASCALLLAWDCLVYACVVF